MLGNRMPWTQIEATLAPAFARPERAGKSSAEDDLFNTTSRHCRQRHQPSLASAPVGSTYSLLCLSHAFNLIDEQVVEHWTENVVWQYKRRP